MWWIVALLLAVFVVIWLWPQPPGVARPVLVVVRDRERDIEGILRSTTRSERPVWVCDLGSSDQTMSIVVRMAREFPHMVVFDGPLGQAVEQHPAQVLTVVKALPGKPWRDLVRELP